MVGVLCEFDFEIKCVKGKENKVADALSGKFHIASMSLCKTELGIRVPEALSNYEFYLHLKE